MKRVYRPGETRARAGRTAPLDLEALAIAALAFLASDPDDLQAFMATTGLDPAGMRQQAGEPHFQRGVLDYMVADEDRIERFAISQGLHPEAIGRAILALDDKPWTADP
jgi:hypothetical protein